MKSTGIVRKVDELGRIVLPIELRHTLEIEPRDPLEIYVDGSTIVLRKYQPACIFCDEAGDVILFRGRNICRRCIRRLNKEIQPPQQEAPADPEALSQPEEALPIPEETQPES